MFVGQLEKIIPIEFFCRGSDLVENVVYKKAPPLFVVILTRLIDWCARWHLFPNQGKCFIEAGRIQFESNRFSNERIIVANAFREMNERAGSIEENPLNHFPPIANWRWRDLQPLAES